MDLYAGTVCDSAAVDSSSHDDVSLFCCIGIN